MHNRAQLDKRGDVEYLTWVADGVLGGSTQGVPKLYRCGVARAPGELARLAGDPLDFVNLQGLQLRVAPLGQVLARFRDEGGGDHLLDGVPKVAHLESVGSCKGLIPGDAPLIARCQVRHLAESVAVLFLNLPGVAADDADGRYVVEVGAGAGVVILECLQFPFFLRDPGEHPALDVGEVGHGQLLARGRDHTPAQRRRTEQHEVVEK